MNVALGFLSLMMAAPALKDSKPQLDFRVVYVRCVGVDVSEAGGVGATFVVTEPDRKDSGQTGQQFRVTYVNADDIRSNHLLQSVLSPKFEVGDCAYWVACRKPDGTLAGVPGRDLLCEHVLPEAEHLLHPLREKTSSSWGKTFPGEKATRELARVVSLGLQTRTADERKRLAAQEENSTNKYVKSYLQWLTDRPEATRR